MTPLSNRVARILHLPDNPTTYAARPEFRRHGIVLVTLSTNAVLQVCGQPVVLSVLACCDRCIPLVTWLHALGCRPSALATTSDGTSALTRPGRPFAVPLAQLASMPGGGGPLPQRPRRLPLSQTSLETMQTLGVLSAVSASTRRGSRVSNGLQAQGWPTTPMN